MAIDSVMSQIYPYWELCICDDGSTDTVILNFLQSLEDGNKKIKVSFLQENKGISITTNQAIKHSSGEYVAFLDHDDELTPDALFEVVKLLNEQPDLDVIYSDQDKITQTGRLKEPFFKPSWSPEYFRAVMYIGHLLIVRREIIIQIGGLDSYFDGIQDYELMLRISEKTSKISHISKILYHWRMLPGSIALGLEEKGKKIDYLQVEAVNRHLIRRGINAEAFPHPKYRHRVVIQPKPRKQSPKISIIILTKDSPVYITRCLSSIFEKTTYPNYEIIVVNNGTTDPLTFSFSKANRIKIIDFRQPFNYSRANNLGVSVAEGEIIVLLNNDNEIISADWLEQMLFYLDDPTISIVGPMLIYPNKRVQHAGIVLGLRGTADHIMRGFPSDSDGYAGSLSSPRTVSAVTGACLMMRKNDYINAGGLIEYYGTHYQDVDLCLRFLSANLRIVYTPYAVLIHYEGATRGKKYDHLDRALLLDTWGDEITKGDQYYNSNFLRDFPDYFAG
jgi:GT2 family glycosyltransferase